MPVHFPKVLAHGHQAGNRIKCAWDSSVRSLKGPSGLPPALASGARASESVSRGGRVLTPLAILRDANTGAGQDHHRPGCGVPQSGIRLRVAFFFLGCKL
jgi:hypothetical protein